MTEIEYSITEKSKALEVLLEAKAPDEKVEYKVVDGNAILTLIGLLSFVTYSSIFLFKNKNYDKV